MIFQYFVLLICAWFARNMFSEFTFYLIGPGMSQHGGVPSPFADFPTVHMFEVEMLELDRIGRKGNFWFYDLKKKSNLRIDDRPTYYYWLMLDVKSSFFLSNHLDRLNNLFCQEKKLSPIFFYVVTLSYGLTTNRVTKTSSQNKLTTFLITPFFTSQIIDLQ